MSYWSISGVLTSDREVLLIMFLNCWKIPQNIKFHKKKLCFVKKSLQIFLGAYFEKNLSVTS